MHKSGGRGISTQLFRYSLKSCYTCVVIIVSVSDQLLHHRRKTGVWYSYPVSTAANGTGNEEGSLQTPLGRHRIAEKIGHGLPLLTAFMARKPVGIYTLPHHHLTRLPWMAGKRANVCEPCETRTFRMAYKQKSSTTFADRETDLDRDWILTRILWLEGCETGRNRRGRVDSQSRYIYIHGTHDEAAIGTPCSHGCIRMRNLDILNLFKHTCSGEQVRIEA